jgi:hypothetical protein
MRTEGTGASHERATVLFALFLSLALCWGYYFLLGDVGLYLGDEGYLWYGVQRTLAGAVPLRDFQSYEPGRYYWCALFGWFGGDGILTERAAAIAFQTVGLVFAILVASRVVRGRVVLAAWGVLVWAWTLQNHRIFEPAMASIATWFAVRLAERPTTGRHLAAGLQAGLAGFIGRNHALYAALASGLVLLFVAWKERGPAWRQRPAAWVAGGAIGSLPMLAMFLLVPGFFAAFRWSAAFLAENPNVPYPWPWPWRIDWAALHGWDLASTAALAAAFLLPCIVLPSGLFSAWRTPRESLPERAVTIGATCAGLFYLHHASVRAHLPHLAECLPPILLLTLGLASGLKPWARRSAWSAVWVVSVVSVLDVHQTLSLFRPYRGREPLVEFDAAGDTVRVTRPQAQRNQALVDFARTNLAPEEPILIAPNRPGLYPLLRKVSPSWWIYFLWPAREEEERKLIAALEERRVDWALIVDRPTDDKQELLFRNSHPLVWEHLMRNFEPFPARDLPADHLVFRRRR